MRQRTLNAKALRDWLIGIIRRWNSIEDVERRYGRVATERRVDGVAQAMADDARCALGLTHEQAKALGLFGE